MTLKDVIAQLHQEDVSVAPYQIHYLLRCRKISQPKKDGAGNYQFESAQLDEIRQQLAERRIRRHLPINQMANPRNTTRGGKPRGRHDNRH